MNIIQQQPWFTRKDELHGQKNLKLNNFIMTNLKSIFTKKGGRHTKR